MYVNFTRRERTAQRRYLLFHLLTISVSVEKLPARHIHFLVAISARHVVISLLMGWEIMFFLGSFNLVNSLLNVASFQGRSCKETKNISRFGDLSLLHFHVVTLFTTY
jgi:hypothetical protein